MVNKGLYVEIAERIMSDILIANLKPGTKVKSVREYALDYKVNPKTIQRAFEYIDDLNIFYTIKGEGRYLSRDSDVIKLIKNQLIDSEAEAFVIRMKSYNLSLEAINQIIKESYERNT